jgi:hypothetical protein
MFAKIETLQAFRKKFEKDVEAIAATMSGIEELVRTCQTLCRLEPSQGVDDDIQTLLILPISKNIANRESNTEGKEILNFNEALAWFKHSLSSDERMALHRRFLLNNLAYGRYKDPDPWTYKEKCFITYANNTLWRTAETTFCRIWDCYRD